MNNVIILDLDVSKSILELGININTTCPSNTIHAIIAIVKQVGINRGVVHRDIADVFQYELSIKYLDNVFPMIFEFDFSLQYINIVLYNDDQTKTYLKIFLSINDDPIIKYIENDKTGFVYGYSDSAVSLKPGEYLMHLSHGILSYIGFDRVRLDDDSYLITKYGNGTEMRTKLWLYLLIKNGKSWYSKFGYQRGNSSIYDFDLILSDINSLNLEEITIHLTKIINAPNRRFIDSNLIEISEKIIAIIGKSHKTLEEFTKNRPMEDFTILTNNLMQSIYSKKLFIENNTREESSNSDDSNNPTYTMVEFLWYDKLWKLFIANVIQINNDVKNSFYRMGQ